MNLQQAFFKHLSAHQGLTALVEQRIYPLILPKNAKLPAVTYSLISDVSQRTLAGAAASPRRARMQASCWGSSYAEATALAAQVAAACQDYQGSMGGQGGVYVLEAEVRNDPDLYMEDAKSYHAPVDVIILYQGGRS